MKIANNIMALNTQRFYTNNNNQISKSAEKLSSGFRINRAGDDAAGLAISEKMRAQIRGMKMAKKNSQDAISMVQTAEGALQSAQNMLQRMNELAVQSATGTNENTTENIDRNALQKEFENLQAEINQIPSNVKFNNMQIFGAGATEGAPQTQAGDTYKATQLTPAASTVAGLDISGLNIKSYLEANSTAASDDVSVSINDGVLTVGTQTITGTVSKVAVANADGVTLSEGDKVDINFTGAGKVTYTVQSGDALIGKKIGDDDADIIKAAKTTTAGKFKVEKNEAEEGDGEQAAAGSNSFTIQVGAEASNVLTISISSLDTESLGVGAAVKIDTADGAAAAITATRAAINTISTNRAELGAMQNRLEYKIEMLANTTENLSSAESRIRDVDLAEEMTQFTKNNILSQAATAMLAQANALPQNVLSLLR